MFCKNCGSQVPEGIAFCAACGTPVAGAPAAAAPVAAAPAAPKADKSGLIKLVAIIAVIAVIAGLFIGLLGGGSAKSVAKKYVKAQIEDDMKKMFSLEAGKTKELFEKECEDEDERFEDMEEWCDEEDIDVKISNYNQYYKASMKLQKAYMKEEYGKKYKVDIEVREVIDMKDKVIDAYRELLSNDACEDYINPDKIKKGKFVVVKVIIDGSKETETEDMVVPVVKYKGSWKVLDLYSFTSMEDYEIDEKDQEDVIEAYSIISKAVSKARGDEVDEDED